PAGSERDRRGRVALGRLSNNVLLGELPKQLSDCVFLFCIGQNQNALARDESLEARKRFFQQSFVRNEAQKLSWARPPAQGPSAFGAAVGEDQRVDRIRHVGAGKIASRKLPFLFPIRDVYGRRCLPSYPFQKVLKSFQWRRCSSSPGRQLASVWES